MTKTELWIITTGNRTKWFILLKIQANDSIVWFRYLAERIKETDGFRLVFSEVEIVHW